MVPEFRRHATFTFCKICPAGFMSISVFCGARGDSSVESARHRHPRNCPPTGSCAINDITRIAPQRGNTQRQLRIPRHHGPMARRTRCPATQSIESGFERCAQALWSGTAFRADYGSGWHSCFCAAGRLEGTQSRATKATKVGNGVESRANSTPAGTGLSRGSDNAHQPRSDLSGPVRAGAWRFTARIERLSANGARPFRQRPRTHPA